MSERAKGWVGPIGVTLVAFVMRVWDLANPRTLSFDERYYAENAWSMLQVGYAQDFIEGAEERIAAGDLDNLMVLGQPTQVVHPDAAKWLIAVGEALFGFDSFGWRIASAVVGALTVLVLARLVLRMTHSVAFACLAGFLLAIDGVHLTLSRLALLDVFVTFWITCAVACLVADRDWFIARLDAPRRWAGLWRPWQVAAGVCFGLACGSKWNGLYALAAFGVTVVVWEIVIRAAWGRVHPIRTTLAVGIPAFLRLVAVALVAYIASYAGWLANHEVYENRFGHGYGDERAWHSTNPLHSLWKYHEMTYRFHTGEYLAKQTHPYESTAAGWLIQARPVSAAVQMNIPAEECGTRTESSCMRETLILGNPAIWWSGVAAMVLSILAWARTHRWEFSVPVVGLVATWAPWLLVFDRPIFAFYSVTTLPFLIIALVLMLQTAWTNARRPGSTVRSRYGAALAIALVVTLSTILAVYFWPIWTYGLISHDAWQARMWFRNWI